MTLPSLVVFFSNLASSATFDSCVAVMPDVPKNLGLLQLGLDQGDLLSNPLKNYDMTLCITFGVTVILSRPQEFVNEVVLSLDQFE